MPSKEIREYLAKLGRKGGKARLETMTAAERSQQARAAVLARWNREDGAALVPARKKTPLKGPKPQKAEAEPENYEKDQR